ncbi:MAG: hypothetical protein GY913_04790 [Proteobacteria bacterium]|nr:hypothetical protein [Pseudomonadota bacterium]
MGILTSVAMAAPLAVHSAGEGLEAEALLQESGVTAELRSFAEVVPLGGPVLTGGVLLTCEGDVSRRYVVDTKLALAEDRLAYVKTDEARVALTEAADALRCLSEPIDAATGARVHYLLGVVAFEVGDTLEARSAFARAHLLMPGLVWDEQFPPDAKDVFLEEGLAVADRPSVELLVVPEPRAAQLTVDGRRIYEAGRVIELTSGTHLVQGPGWSVEVDVLAGSEPVLLVPDVIEDEGAQWMADEDACRSLDEVVGQQGRTLYLVAGEQAWERIEGAWSPLTDVSLETCRDLDPPAVVEGFLLPQEGAPRALAVGGLAGVAGGGALAITGYAVAAQAARNATTWDGYQDAKGRHAVGSAMLTTGEVIAVTGAVSFASGLVIERMR